MLSPSFCSSHRSNLLGSSLRPQRRFHPRCGTSFLFVVVIISILVFSLVSLRVGLWDNPWVRTGLRLQISVLLGHFVGSMVITSLALRIFYGYPWATLAVRIPNALILAAVNTVLLRILLENRALMKMVKK